MDLGEHIKSDTSVVNLCPLDTDILLTKLH